MKKTRYIIILLLAFGCKEKYVSPVESPNTGYLVIEGTVNNGIGTTNIRLTRTSKLKDQKIIFETKAQVRVEGENSASYSLTEKTAGNYSAENLTLSNTQKYRLRIRTNGGSEYISDFVEVKKNPPIDSISWKRSEDGGVQLYIHTHDDQNKTHYYQWEYNETWEFHSAYRSTLKIIYTNCSNQGCLSAHVDYRDPSLSYDRSMYTCWQSNLSSNLLLGSTIALSKDEVYLPLLSITPKSWKLSELYSVNVTQTAWEKEGYEFLEKMKKNTEIVGSVFDPQPSEIKGNIRSSANPAEPVIGFFNICNIEQKRIWINKSQVPNWGYVPDCTELEVTNHKDSILGYAYSIEATTVKTLGLGGGISTFGASSPECVDCTLKGTNVKPTFWP